MVATAVTIREKVSPAWSLACSDEIMEEEFEQENVGAAPRWRAGGADADQCDVMADGSSVRARMCHLVREGAV
jgi:hypothetical protein